MKNTAKLFLVFAGGALAGAAAGLLLAPEKGDVTRSNISNAAKKAKTNLDGKIEEGKKVVNKLTSDIRQMAANFRKEETPTEEKAA